LGSLATSILSTLLYEQLFHMYVSVIRAFLDLQFVFEFFDERKLGEKSANKILGKLTRKSTYFEVLFRTSKEKGK